MMAIHNSAIIEDGAYIHPSCEIGPYCIIGPNVKLGEHVHLHSHVVISGHTEIGAHTEIFPFASIGGRSQDLKHKKGERSYVIIGKHNMIREYVTINAGTDAEAQTIIGDNCLIMIGAHIAHDCVIGNHVVIANNSTLAGHVTISDYCILGGLSAYHQFVRVGRYAIIGGGSIVVDDVIPYANVKGERAYLSGLNLVGMKRNQLERQEILTIQKAFDAMFDYESGIPLEDRMKAVQEQYADQPRVMEIITFSMSDSKRPLCMPKADRTSSKQD